MFKLRDYQEEAVQKALETDNGVFVLPTGSGKSLVIAGIVNALKDNVLVLQPNKEILEQNFNKICEMGFEDAKIYSASLKTKEKGKVTYATIGSIINKLDLFADVKTVIIDEAHLVNPKGGRYEQLIKELKPDKLIGLTATPYRLATNSYGSFVRLISRTRPKLFKEISYIVENKELIEKFYIHKPDILITTDRAEEFLEPNTAGSDYSFESVEKFFEEARIEEKIMEAVFDAVYEKNLQHVLLFVPEVMMSHSIVEMINETGIPSASIDSKTSLKDRTELIKKFREGEIRIVSNVGVLTTGFDFPKLDCIIMARPTMSLSLYYQMIGRCVRPHPMKQTNIVYDLVNNYKKFGNPLEIRYIEPKKNVVELLCENGRITGRALTSNAEKFEKVWEEGQRGTKLKDLPDSWINQFLLNAKKKDEVYRQIYCEKYRRLWFPN